MLEKIKACKVCGKTSNEVKFTLHKGVCNPCRIDKMREEDSSPEQLVLIWQERTNRLSKVYLKGNDPCVGCRYDKCVCCGVFHVKKLYFLPKSKEAGAFLSDFNKNLLAKLKIYTKVIQP